LLLIGAPDARVKDMLSDHVVHNHPYEYPNDRQQALLSFVGLALGGIVTVLFCAWLYVST